MNAISLRNRVVSLLVLAVAISAGPALAVTDYSGLTGAVDVAGVTTAILAVAALMMAVVVVRWGTRKILGFFR